jgi:hypothetical protein
MKNRGIIIQPLDNSRMKIPKNVTNARDRRLYQHFAAQADLIITSGRYVRDWAADFSSSCHAQPIPRSRVLASPSS